MIFLILFMLFIAIACQVLYSYHLEEYVGSVVLVCFGLFLVITGFNLFFDTSSIEHDLWPFMFVLGVPMIIGAPIVFLSYDKTKPRRSEFETEVEFKQALKKWNRDKVLFSKEEMAKLTTKYKTTDSHRV